MIGGIALSAISFFKNIPLKRENSKKEPNDERILSIFSKLDIEKNKTIKTEDRFDKMREYLIPIMVKKSSITAIVLLFILFLVILPFEIGAMYLVIVAMFYMFLIYYPKIKQQRSYNDLNHELPYALRHMGIELKSGKGLHDTLITIRDADYGTFSKEINRVLEEVKFGKSTEDSLLEMSKRVKSEGLTRTIQQMIGTLRVGGNLANSLDVIAKDI